MAQIGQHVRLTFYTRISERLCRSRHTTDVRRASWWSTAIFGVTPFLLFNWGFWTRIDFANRPYLPLVVTVYIASFWILLAPALITKWEQRYREFLSKIYGSAADDSRKSEWKRIANRWLLTSVLCGTITALTAAALHELARPYLQTVISIPDWSDVYFTTLLVLTATGYATGIGFAGVFHTIRMYQALADVELPWAPFHQDQRGGYAFLTDFALGTAAIFAGGVTVAPAALAIGAFVGGIGQITIFGLVIAYGFLTALIFFWPMTMIFKKGQKKKQETLGFLSPILDGAVNSILLSSEAKPSRTEAIIELDKLRDKIVHIDKVLMLYEKISIVKVTPFSMGSVVQVISFSALPIIIAGAQLIVSFYSDLSR